MVIIVNETKVIILIIYVVMRDGFDIFFYLIPLAIWLFSFFQQAQKKAKKKTVNTPQPQPVVLESSEKIEQEMERIEREMRQQKQERKKATFLGRDPYKESIEYRKRKEKKLRKMTKMQESNASESEFSEIDWKKAVVYSEILKPRF